MNNLLAALDRFLEAARRVTRDRALGPVRRQLERAMGKAFRAQGRAFLKRFATLRQQFTLQEAPPAVRNRDWEWLFDDAARETLRAFERPLTAAARRALKAGALRAIADVAMGISFSLKNPRAVAYLQAVGAARVTAINETTRDYLRTVITNGVDEGWSYDRMAAAITERYSEFAVGKPQEHIDSRAHLIAINESAEAYESANYMIGEDLRDAGIEMEKRWSTMEDDKVSDGCRKNGEAGVDGWIPFDDVFPSGDLRPPRFPGCRCDLYTRRVRAEEASV